MLDSYVSSTSDRGPSVIRFGGVQSRVASNKTIHKNVLMKSIGAACLIGTGNWSLFNFYDDLRLCGFTLAVVALGLACLLSSFRAGLVPGLCQDLVCIFPQIYEDRRQRRMKTNPSTMQDS
jgi:hypothetical protein